LDWQNRGMGQKKRIIRRNFIGDSMISVVGLWFLLAFCLALDYEKVVASFAVVGQGLPGVPSVQTEEGVQIFFRSGLSQDFFLTSHKMVCYGGKNSGI